MVTTPSPVGPSRWGASKLQPLQYCNRYFCIKHIFNISTGNQAALVKGSLIHELIYSDLSGSLPWQDRLEELCLEDLSYARHRHTAEAIMPYVDPCLGGSLRPFLLDDNKPCLEHEFTGWVWPSGKVTFSQPRSVAARKRASEWHKLIDLFNNAGHWRTRLIILRKMCSLKPPYPITMRVDGILTDGTKAIIADWKTTSSYRSQVQYFDLSVQRLLLEYLGRDLFSGRYSCEFYVMNLKSLNCEYTGMSPVPDAVKNVGLKIAHLYASLSLCINRLPKRQVRNITWQETLNAFSGAYTKYHGCVSAIGLCEFHPRQYGNTVCSHGNLEDLEGFKL